LSTQSFFRNKYSWSFFSFKIPQPKGFGILIAEKKLHSYLFQKKDFVLNKNYR